MRAQAGGGGPAWKTPEQGAATSVLVAASPLLDGVGGRYFEDCNEAGLNQPGTRPGVAAYALDPRPPPGCGRYPPRCWLRLTAVTG